MNAVINYDMTYREIVDIVGGSAGNTCTSFLCLGSPTFRCLRESHSPYSGHSYTTNRAFLCHVGIGTAKATTRLAHLAAQRWIHLWTESLESALIHLTTEPLGPPVRNIYAFRAM